MVSLPHRVENSDDGRYAQVVYVENTAARVPVPSIRDALGQHHVARVLRRAGYDPLPPYHPEVFS